MTHARAGYLTAPMGAACQTDLMVEPIPLTEASQLSVPDQPKRLRSAMLMLWSLRLRRPGFGGATGVDHAAYGEILTAIYGDGVEALRDRGEALDGYVASRSQIDPESLAEQEALAYWINLYNAGAQRMALEALQHGLPTVLRVPNTFGRPFVSVAGERLSLNDIEHGKVRRFKDPRIHGALNCCLLSCPTLLPEPYRGDTIDERLDGQMRHFLTHGGLIADRDAGQVLLSRIFSWFGGDFVHPSRMPNFMSASGQVVLGALTPWIDDETRAWIEATAPSVSFQLYDWGLRVAVTDGRC